MFPAAFEYHRADTLEEALRLLQEHEGAKLLAGGHSLLPMMKLRMAEPPVLIDIGRIEALGGIREDQDRLEIGSLTTHTQLCRSPLLAKRCPLLVETASQIADPQVRNRGTLGGNLAHADPGSDLPAVLLVLEGILHVLGPSGSRSVPASEFFLDLLTTALGEGEILKEVEVPVPPEGTGWAYLKCEHPASGYAVCGAAALVSLEADGRCRSVRLGFNGVGATPFRAGSVERALEGSVPDEATLGAAFSELEAPEPVSDAYASGEYRLELARVYGLRALRRAVERAS